MRPRAVLALQSKAQKKPFIVDVPAKMLQRNTKLSRGARMLYTTMRALANGKTGELAIRGNPLDWKYICRQAEFSRPTWHKLLRELVSAGYVSYERERVTIWKDGRKRIVLGKARYFVHRQPKTVKNPRILLRDNSCTVQEVSPQISSNTPSSAVLASDGVALRVSSPVGEKHQSSSPAKLGDDLLYSLSFKEKKEEKTRRSFEREVRDHCQRIDPKMYELAEPYFRSDRFMEAAYRLVWLRVKHGAIEVTHPKQYFARSIIEWLYAEDVESADSIEEVVRWLENDAESIELSEP